MRFNPEYIRTMIIGEAERRRLVKNMKDEIKFVEKSWGWEKWFANTPEYCGKELHVDRGKWSSKGKYHYHNIKDETFYIIKGTLSLDYVDENNIFYSTTLPKGTSFRVKPGIKHRFSTITLGGCNFIEASTHHDDEDSYRCYYDLEKGEWIHV